jgi:hypothetical protein
MRSDKRQAHQLRRREVAMTAHDGERPRVRISIGTNRRAFLKSAGVGVAAASSFRMASPTRAESRTIKIGFIGAQSGVGANFGEATPWTVDRARPWSAVSSSSETNAI